MPARKCSPQLAPRSFIAAHGVSRLSASRSIGGRRIRSDGARNSIPKNSLDCSNDRRTLSLSRSKFEKLSFG